MFQMPRLNLPAIEYEIRMNEDSPEILDPLRRKFVALTPEEWVRQHFTAWLISDRQFPRSFIANEIGLKINGCSRRADTVVFSTDLVPRMVIEYKRPSVSITQRVFDQIVRYNMVFKAPYVVVSNGMAHYCCHIDFEKRSYEFLPEIPLWDSL